MKERSGQAHVQELVAAIKSYSQMDRASMQQIDVADGIDSALVMLGHKLGAGISVVRDYSASVTGFRRTRRAQPGVDQSHR